MATSVGEPDVAEKPKQSHQCCFCKRFADVAVKFKRCSGCHATKYCSNRCQKKHWPEHKSLCKTIQELIARNQASSVPSSLGKWAVCHTLDTSTAYNSCKTCWETLYYKLQIE